MSSETPVLLGVSHHSTRSNCTRHLKFGVRKGELPSLLPRALSHMLIAKVNCDVSGNGMEREGLSSVKKAKWVMDEKFASNQDARAVAEYDQLL